MAETTKETNAEQLVISKPRIRSVKVRLNGDSPLMVARFSAKAMQQMASKMLGEVSPGKKTREPRKFEEDYENAFHRDAENGWAGFPASGLRAACIRACSIAGYKMVMAKMSVFVIGEGLDKVDGLPLMRIYGEPEMNQMAVRNATGVADIRIRPLWRKWHIDATVRYDADQFSLVDVLNLLDRAGAQVGLGEGRPMSKDSVGLGFGTWTTSVIEAEQE